MSHSMVGKQQPCHDHDRERREKILFVNQAAMMSGAEFSLLGLMTKLAQTRFQPLLLLSEPGLFKEKAEALGIDVVVLPTLLQRGEHYRPWKALRIARVAWTIRRLIRARRISLVHCNNLCISYIVGLAARLAGIPAVLHVRDSGLAGIMASWKGYLLTNLFDHFIAVSQAARDSIAAVHPRLGKKTTVIYNGVDLEAFDKVRAAPIREELGIAPTAPLVGAVGRIDPAKGYDALMDAIKILRNAFPDLRLLVVGPVFEAKHQAYMDKLQQNVKNDNLLNVVFFSGFRADALEIEKALDILVHPAICPDSLPRVILEAAAFAKPIIASRIGGIPEILEDQVSGILVESGDGNALATALATLLAHTAQAKQLGMAARKKMEKTFTAEKHLDAVVSLYESLLSNQPKVCQE